MVGATSSLSDIPATGVGLDVRNGGIRCTDTDANGISSIELGTGGNGNRLSYFDITSDDTYTDYGFRIIRWNSGANSNTDFIHRGTGAFNLAANEAGAVNLMVNGTIRLQASNTGICYNGSFGTCSDIRYKKNIIPIKDALASIKKINGVNYHWRKDEFKDKGFSDLKQYGVIAQDLEKTFPEMVITDNDGYKSVDYSRLIPVLIEALKEQQNMIELQSHRIEGLNQKVEVLLINLKQSSK